LHVWLADAKPLHERALAIDDAAHGPGHPDVATDLNNLAVILQALGQPEAARPLQEHDLAINEGLCGQQGPRCLAGEQTSTASADTVLGYPHRALSMRSPMLPSPRIAAWRFSRPPPKARGAGRDGDEGSRLAAYLPAGPPARTWLRRP
jgi:hypothetical protein